MAITMNINEYDSEQMIEDKKTIALIKNRSGRIVETTLYNAKLMKARGECEILKDEPKKAGRPAKES